MTFDYDINAVAGEFLSLILPSQRIFVLYLATALGLAAVSWAYLRRSGRLKTGDGPRGFLSWVADKRIYTHTSTLQDLKIFALNAVIYYALVAQFYLSSQGVTAMTSDWLTQSFGPVSAPVLDGKVLVAIYTVLAVLVFDFAVFIAHYAFHKIPALWEFHKVHHSAEVLTPLTLYRMHPVDLFLTSAVIAVCQGLLVGGLFYLCGKTPYPLTVLGLNVFVFGFYIAGYNLRHSHIWFNFPHWLNRILISPAQHQIHHSVRPEHWDKNMGLIFSFWDQLFGTHLNPRQYEKLEYGVDDRRPNPYASVVDLYIKPFRDAARRIPSGRTGLAAPAIVAACIGAYALAHGHLAGGFPGNLPRSVELADLTWTEARAALDDGYDTVIIPTAGFEQNGPHVVLDKHNLVVSHTARRIAETLGHTLVAPAINYVPEGAVEPTPEGHMNFTGTISVPEPVFEAVLEAAARSLRSHGFRNIAFVGDSGGNQESQARVAAKLSEEWRNSGAHIAHIAEYYSANGQFDALLQQGFSEEEIGYHAGIRDTSELLFVRPGAVHMDFTSPPADMPWGMSGHPQLATAKIGRQMIQMKIDAGVRSIREKFALPAEDGTAKATLVAAIAP